MKASDLKHLYMRRAQRVAVVLAITPFIRLIGLNGSVARGEVKPGSDIDFLIISTPERLFTVRFLATLLVHALGLRRYGRHIAGRICLNRYQTTHSLEVVPHNAYHREVFSQLIPLLDIDHTYQAYCKANQWMGEPLRQTAGKRHRTSRLVRVLHPVRRLTEALLGGWLGDWFEQRLKKMQLEKIMRNPLTSRYPDRIKATDTFLLFHPPAPGEIDTVDLDRWDLAADAYNQLQGKNGDVFRRQYLDPVMWHFLGDVQGKRILDAGCGNGYFVHQLSKRGAQATGVDGSSAIVALAQQNFPDISVKVADLAVKLPYASAYFDCIVSSMVLQDLAKPCQTLAEFARLIKKDGKVIIAITHPAFTYPAARRRRGIWRRLTGQATQLEVGDYYSQRSVVVPLEGMNIPTRRYHRPIETYSRWFKEAGFSIEELVEVRGSTPHPVALVIGLRIAPIN